MVAGDTSWHHGLPDKEEIKEKGQNSNEQMPLLVRWEQTYNTGHKKLNNLNSNISSIEYK